MLARRPAGRQVRKVHVLLAMALAGGVLFHQVATASEEAAEGPQFPPAPQLPAFEIFGPGELWSRLGRVPTLEVGTWIEYRVSSAEQSDRIVRISVVPQTGLPTPEHRVVETRVDEPTGDRNYVKMLLTGVEGGARRLEALMVKEASFQPMMMPVGGGDAEVVQQSTEAEPGGGLKIDEVGIVSLETPAGTFRTRHVRVVGEGEDAPPIEVWMDVGDSVPLWGIVKSNQAGTISVLEAHGDGARSDLPPIRPRR